MIGRREIALMKKTAFLVNASRGGIVNEEALYEALKEDNYRGTKSYSNDPSTEYLKQISISARFMVETNLNILRQQERIIQLLHSYLKKK